MSRGARRWKLNPPAHQGKQTDPAAQLAAIVETRRRLDVEERAAVAELREAGATWDAIGDALGVSKQAARKRFTLNP